MEWNEENSKSFGNGRKEWSCDCYPTILAQETKTNKIIY